MIKKIVVILWRVLNNGGELNYSYSTRAYFYGLTKTSIAFWPVYIVCQMAWTSISWWSVISADLEHAAIVVPVSWSTVCCHSLLPLPPHCHALWLTLRRPLNWIPNRNEVARSWHTPCFRVVTAATLPFSRQQSMHLIVLLFSNDHCNCS